jgi:hypothetical protein
MTSDLRTSELHFGYVAAALRHRHGERAVAVAAREAEELRRGGDDARAELWLRVVRELVAPTADLGA